MQMVWQPQMYSDLAPDMPAATPEESAKKANAVSERLYAELLVSSGYMQLVHQVALLRHLSTEPDRSETVEVRKVTYRGDAHDARWMTAKSGPIPFSDPVVSEAHLATQNFRARALLSTQPPGRQRAVSYRILLRSVKLDQLGPNEIADPEYESVYRARYVPEDTDVSFNRLAIEFDGMQLRDELLLYEGVTPAAATPVVREGESELQADTFDWYMAVPTLARPSPGGAESAVSRLERLGWIEEMARPAGVSGPIRAIDGAATALPADAAGALANEWKAAKAAPGGERRNLRQERCTIAWKLRWEGNRLAVTLQGRAQDRNCALFLVIEEKLISGQFLHTAVAIAMNTQLTTVPQSFFDAEQAAWARAFGVISEVARRDAATGDPAAPGPIVEGVPISRFVQQFGVAGLANRYLQVAPQLVRSVLAEFPLSEQDTESAGCR